MKISLLVQYNIREGDRKQIGLVFSHRRKVDRDDAEVTLSGRLFQIVGPVTGKAWLPTMDCLMDVSDRLGTKVLPTAGE